MLAQATHGQRRHSTSSSRFIRPAQPLRSMAQTPSEHTKLTCSYANRRPIRSKPARLPQFSPQSPTSLPHSRAARNAGWSTLSPASSAALASATASAALDDPASSKWLKLRTESTCAARRD
eukprot:4912694-Pleurochrysis_carterae.AAC.3